MIQAQQLLDWSEYFRLPSGIDSFHSRHWYIRSGDAYTNVGRSIMPRTFDQILADFAALKLSDFDNEAEGVDKLYGLTDELMTYPQPERAIPALFDVMERMPDVEMGTPGPLVHSLEQMPGRYERELVESIKRKPTPLAIWMVNRILNGTQDKGQRQIYLDLLRFSAIHPAAPDSARHGAQHFIEYQGGAI